MSLDELERRFVRAAQHELRPSAADRERNEVALLGRLDGEPWSSGSGAGFGGAGPLNRAPRSGALATGISAARSSRLGLLGVGLIVGAMVGGWFGFGLGRSGWNAFPARVPDAVTASRAAPGTSPEASPAVAEARAPVPEVRIPEAAASALGDAAALPDATRHPARAASEARASRRAPVPAQPESSLAAELAMLQRARRALNAENGQLALGIVQELDERFPEGVLVEERSAMRIASLCQLERVAEARQAASDFVERHPSSVYAERVRRSCAAP